MVDRPDTLENDAQWRTAGDRIQTLLDSCAASGAVAYERAQELVREVVGLYGAGLERMIKLSGDPGMAERLATDDLVASLLLVHGLHPHDVHRRVSDALDRVRPYLGSHGGDVDLIEVTQGPEGAGVLLAFKGSCKSCPSSAVTLELAELEPGEVGGFAVSGTTVLACRVDDQTFAYRDACPVCDDSLAGAALHGALLRCPRCPADFDVVHAGAGPDGTHLDPLPLLTRDGVLSVALRGEAIGARA